MKYSNTDLINTDKVLIYLINTDKETQAHLQFTHVKSEANDFFSVLIQGSVTSWKQNHKLDKNPHHQFVHLNNLYTSPPLYRREILRKM